MIAQLDKEYLKIRPAKLWCRLISYGLFEGRPITTKGQWINPLVFKIFIIWEKLPQLKKTKFPIFIIGTGRSGTTILGILLSIHKEVSYLNEPKALWHEIYSEEDIIGTYSNGIAFYSLQEKQATDEISKKARKIYGAYLRLTGGKRILDKYPEMIFRIPFITKIFPDARFLFITRNGEDTLQSIEHWSNRLGTVKNNEVHDWWGVNDRKWKLLCEQLICESNLLMNFYDEVKNFTNHKDRATVEWILTMEKGLIVSKTCPQNVFQFKYEDFLKNHIDVINQIYSFTGLPVDKKVFKYAQKIVTPPPPKKKVNIHPLLKEPFYHLMDELHYK